MTRGLYRVYLYAVTIALAGFLTGTFGVLLGALFGLTPLRGSGGAPDARSLTQAGLLFAVTLIIAGGFGALHYWLIRRDSATDPAANESGVRTFLLNLAELIVVLMSISTGVSSLEQIGQRYAPDLSYPLAIALATAGLALALEWERRRLTPTHGAALVFERLRRHGVPLILLSTVLPAIYNAVSQTERIIAQQAGAFACNPASNFSGPEPIQNYSLPTCVGNEVAGAWLGAVVAVGVWLWFLWLGMRDGRSLLRQVLLLLGWAAGGMVILVIALERAAEYILRLLTPGVASPSYLNQFDFGPLAAMATVALAMYGWTLRERVDPAMTTQATRLTMRALAGAILAAPLWIGVFLAIHQAFNAVAPGAIAPTASDWDMASAFLIAGLGYIPLAFWLGADTQAWDIRGPRRGFVLALLAAGALVTAAAAATLLYAVVSPVLGAPLGDWQETARTAGAALITGAALGGLYLFIALREKQFTGAPKAPEATPEAPAVPATAGAAASPGLDEVLAQFKGGDISQDTAAERIRDLARAGALV
ncbi:MAG TPA: hypothetical protein VF808_19770 [Ktedonobacterales bacterium]